MIMCCMADISDKTSKWLRDKGYDGGESAIEALI